MRSRYVVVLAVLVAAVVVIGLVVTSYAQEQGAGAAGPGTMGRGGGMGGRMGGGGMGMGGTMGDGMGVGHMGCMGHSGIAASGEYIYVLSGPMLQQYDRNLNFVKEVEIKMNPEAMRRMRERYSGMGGGGTGRTPARPLVPRRRGATSAPAPAPQPAQ